MYSEKRAEHGVRGSGLCALVIRCYFGQVTSPLWSCVPSVSDRIGLVVLPLGFDAGSRVLLKIRIYLLGGGRSGGLAGCPSL